MLTLVLACCKDSIVKTNNSIASELKFEIKNGFSSAYIHCK